MTDLPEPASPPLPPIRVPEGWEDILDPGERILWQGRPAAGIDWASLADTRTPFGLFFAGFACFWMWMAASMGAPGIFPLFGLPFLAVGLYLAFGRVLWAAYARSRSHYTLTDRHAFIATEILGRRRLDRHALEPGMALVLEDGQPGTVWFAEKVIHHPGGHTGSGKHRHYRGPRTERRRIGFERIAEARQVYRLLREAAARLAPPEDTR